MDMTLLEALEQADDIIVDDYKSEHILFPGHEGAPPQVVIELSDESQFTFTTDQRISLNDGQAFVNDIDGEEHEMFFTVCRPLGT